MGPSHGKELAWWWSVPDRDVVWLHLEWRQTRRLCPCPSPHLSIIYTTPSAARRRSTCGDRQAEHPQPFGSTTSQRRLSRIVTADPKWPTHNAALVEKRAACEQIPSLGDKGNVWVFLSWVVFVSLEFTGVSSVIAWLHICFVWTILFVRGQWMKRRHQPSIQSTVKLYQWARREATCRQNHE